MREKFLEFSSMQKFPIGQGHGIEGRYGGFTDEFADLSEACVVILPVPFDFRPPPISMGPKRLLML